ncbi:MAG: aldose epimerase family protein [Acidobacteria bacterium]|nr:aldose epimerase family protein [Acidobacteriota bacterium]
MVTQSAGGARIEIDLDAGCRIASLEVGGHQLLVTGAASPIDWGCYPMAPYAGRVRDGRFTFRGRSYRLPRTLGGHAIHGSVYKRRWEAESDVAFVTELGPEWPLAGRARQEIRADADGIRFRLEVHSEGGAMPAACGWHPWFRRVVAGAGAVLEFHPGFMYERDAAGIATRERRPVAAGPWDDCFGGVEEPPVITWPGVLRLELESTCGYWVVFTEREHALCVEPQTAPPDSLNQDPFVVEPGRPLVAECTMRWDLLGDPAARVADRTRR